jgi:hypothetical protein
MPAQEQSKSATFIDLVSEDNDDEDDEAEEGEEDRNRISASARQPANKKPRLEGRGAKEEGERGAQAQEERASAGQEEGARGDQKEGAKDEQEERASVGQEKGARGDQEEGARGEQEEGARAYDRAARAHNDDKAVPNFPAEADDEHGEAQEQAAAGPVEMHSWSGMYPSVVIALGFRLQVRIPRVAGAEAEKKSAEGDRLARGEGRKVNHGAVVKEAGVDTTWACESILRKRHAAGSNVEYEVCGH